MWFLLGSKLSDNVCGYFIQPSYSLYILDITTIPAFIQCLSERVMRMGRYQSQFEWHPAICLPSNWVAPLDVQINLLVAAFHLSVSWSSVGKDGGNGKGNLEPFENTERHISMRLQKKLYN
jgi:hypothetical protein